ncbi:hypothetical protein TNCV_2920341 [Trichonephila clavipes]|nr:hypothetical protein TNCV_2920341 [Trichonephila clavipes]
MNSIKPSSPIGHESPNFFEIHARAKNSFNSCTAFDYGWIIDVALRSNAIGNGPREISYHGPRQSPKPATPLLNLNTTQKLVDSTDLMCISPSTLRVCSGTRTRTHDSTEIMQISSRLWTLSYRNHGAVVAQWSRYRIMAGMS